VRRADYLVKRAAFAIVTVFVAITINFFLFRVLPGDAVRNLARVPRASESLRHALEVQFGLDKSLFAQYLIYLRELAHGNMGISFSNQQPVSENLREALANTIPMAALGTVVAIVIRVSTGSCRRGGAAPGSIRSARTRRSRSTRSRRSGWRSCCSSTSRPGSRAMGCPTLS
jgi:ABC-type dipeptide/oligopeptide/nickel transport system permease component